MPLDPRKLPSVVKLRGHELSRTSVNLRFGALPVIGWTAINFETVRVPGTAHGSNGKVVAVTRGKVTFSASLTVYERDWADIRKMLVDLGKAQNDRSWSEVRVLVTLAYYEPPDVSGGAAGVQVVELVGCQVVSAKQAIGDSDDQLCRELTLSVLDILEDQASAVSQGTGG